jgi:hypothetical protein
MSVTLSDKRRTVEYEFGYGALHRYRLAVAEAYGVKEALIAAIMPPFSDIDEVFIKKVEEKVPDEVADFLFACDCGAEFNQKQSSVIYHALKDITLPKNYNPVITAYGKTYDLHKAFIEVFGLGRYKNNGVLWA